MNDINTIVVCRDDYESKEDFENAIKDAVMVLLNNNYIMTVRYDDMGVVVIDFNHDNQEYGCDYPHWLSPDEFESIAWEE